MTPNRPDATCLMREVARSPSRRPRRCGSDVERPSVTPDIVSHRTGSSPPSPELDLPPMRFMATAIVSCVSREMAPSDMPPVQKRATMAATGSTSSTEIGAPAGLSSRQSRSTDTGESTKCCMYASYAPCPCAPLPPRPTALWSSLAIAWLLTWCSPLGRDWMKP